MSANLSGCLSTPGRAASLTHKQADIMSGLCEGPMTKAEIHGLLEMLIHDDYIENDRRYLSADPTATLATLMARGLVYLIPKTWTYALTLKGERAAEAAEL